MIIDKNSPIPQYFQLQTWLLEQIEQGVFKVNDKILTDDELVQMTSLARATVRQAVQNLVNMGYLVRKRRLGTFVINRKSDTNKYNTVGIIIPDIRRGYAPELARGAEDEAAKVKRSLILCNTDDLYFNAEFQAQKLIDHSVGGVIFIPTAASDAKNRLIIEKFTQKNIPVVLADRQISTQDIDCVTTNNFQGAYELTQYLIQKGHKKIAIILSTLFSTERQRLEGYEQALQDNNITVDNSIIMTGHEPFIEKHYLGYCRKLLTQRHKYTAILAGHDRIAFLLYAVSKEMGISIPDDVSIVGYDDLQYASFPLTTMHQPIYEMGRESMKLIIAQLDNEVMKPQRIILESYFVERASVKRI